MDTNYAARDRPSGQTSDAPSTPAMVRSLRAGFVLALAIQVFVLYLYAPGPSDTLAIPHADKAVHVLVFAAPAAIGVLARIRPWLVGVVLAAHAPLSELVQHLWLPTRSGDPWDVVADWVGVALGLVFAVRLVSRRERPRA